MKFFSSLATALMIALIMMPEAASADGEDVFFGERGTADGQFSDHVRGFDVDTAGNFYVLDGGYVDANGNIVQGSHQTIGLFRVTKFNRDAEFVRHFNVYDPALGVSNTPTRIAVSDTGSDVYVLFTQANQVRRYVNGILTATITAPTAVASLSQYQGPFEGKAVNAGGIYFRTVGGTPYLYIALNDGVTLRRIDTVTGTTANIVLSRQASRITDIAVGTGGELFVLGTDALTGGGHMLMCYGANGTWINSYGCGAIRTGTTGARLGDNSRHAIDVDAAGNVYTMGSMNEAPLLKFAFSEGLVYYRTGQLKFGSPYSADGIGSDVFVGVGRADGRVYGLTSHTTHDYARHMGPRGMRMRADYFNKTQTRSIETIGLDLMIENGPVAGVSYTLAPISFDFVVPSASRVLKDIIVAYAVYDIHKNTVESGTFSLPLTDGQEARKSLAFTPPGYGWYSATFQIYRQSVTPENRVWGFSTYLGATPAYPGMPILNGSDHEVKKHAFAGLGLCRVLTRESDAVISTAATNALQHGVNLILMFETAASCDRESVEAAVNRYKDRIQHYEIVNEPNLSMGVSNYVALLSNVHGWIKAIQPDAKVLAPVVCGMDLAWLRKFYEFGGKSWCDILSVHDYEGNESLDPAHWDWKFGELKTLMQSFGDGDKPVWQTEHGFTGIRGGSFLGPCQAVRETLHLDALERAGLTTANSHYFYMDNHGFASYPSYLCSKTGPHPALFALRTRFGLLHGTLPVAQLDFGTLGNRLFSGARYQIGTTNVVMLRNLGQRELPLTVQVSGASTLEVFDCFGNVTTVVATNGLAEIQTGTLPTYARLAAGQNLAIPPVNFGHNLAHNATFSYSASHTGSMAMLNNGIFETLHPSNPHKEPWWGEKGTNSPEVLEIELPTVARLKELVVFSSRADNPYSTLLDYDVSFWNGSDWTLAKQVRSTLPPSDLVNQFDHTAQTWYLDENFSVVPLPGVRTSRLRLVIYRTTYGFCPDDTAVDAMRMAWGSMNSQRLTLSEVEIYGDLLPECSTRSATNVTASSAWINGSLTSTGTAATAVIAYWGTSDGGTNLLAWSQSQVWSAPQALGGFTHPITGLSSDSTTYFRFAASNEIGIIWSKTTEIFITGAVTINTISDADEATLAPGVIRVARPTVTLGAPLTVAYAKTGGTAVAGTDFVPLSGSVVIPADSLSADIAVTPISNWAVHTDTTLKLTLQSGSYLVGSPYSAMLTIVNEGLPAAPTNTWIRSGTDPLASTGANWSLGHAPTNSDAIIFLLPYAAVPDMTWNLPNAVAGWVQAADYTGTVTFQTVYGKAGFTNFNISGNCSVLGGSWTHGANSSAETYRLRVTVGGDLTLDGGAINVTGKGYRYRQGPGGAVTENQGGAYGGVAYHEEQSGPPNLKTYGSIDAPIHIGSGGGDGGSFGGGAIFLTVAGRTLIGAASTLVSRGNEISRGSGSGGSILLETGRLEGGGTISANGGGYRYGGGGGRAAVILTDAGANFNAWTGTISAYGFGRSGAGTVYLQSADGIDTLIIDNNNLNAWTGATTLMTTDPAVNLNAFDEIIIRRRGILGIASTTTLDMSLSNVTLAGTADSAIDIYADDNLVYPTDWDIASMTVYGEGISKTLNNVTISATGLLSHRPNLKTEEHKLEVNIAGNLTVQSGGSISAMGMGFIGYNGSGYSVSEEQGGAHGGVAGWNNNNSGAKPANARTYGSILNPVSIGSGGQYAGGGAILLNVGGTTTVASGASITAEGIQTGNRAGGSGGSVNLRTGWLAGDGTINAKGGGNYCGGGGRVAVTLTAGDFSGWSGSILAQGYGTQGGAGTVYLAEVGTPTGAGQVVVDNNNQTRWGLQIYTPLPAFATAMENLRHTQWALRNKGSVKLVAEAKVQSLEMQKATILDLNGHTLTLYTLIIDGQKIGVGTHTAAELASPLITDTTGSGQIVLRGVATLLITR